jgi:DNA (cytosine-5)-methyltransferase 1
MGRPLKEGDFYHAVGNFTNVDYVRRDMDMEWASRDGIREAIPPAYTEFIGRQLMAQLQERAA